MAMIFRLRWRLAHLICPELGVEARLSSARAEKAALQLPEEPGARWVAAIDHASRAVDVYVAIDQVISALRVENCRRSGDDRQLGLLMCGVLAQITMPQASAQNEPFLPADRMSELVAQLRHGRIERAKEILKIVQSVQLHGLPGDDDAALDALAKRFAFLVFGKK